MQVFAEDEVLVAVVVTGYRRHFLAVRLTYTVWLPPTQQVAAVLVPSAAADSDASRRDGEWLSDDRAVGGIFAGQDPVGLDHQRDGFTKIRSGFFE